MNEVLKRAFARCVAVIGKVAKKVPDGARREFPVLEWKKMSGMRDRQRDAAVNPA
jgi:uncharacterized protein with HEPN domain